MSEVINLFDDVYSGALQEVKAFDISASEATTAIQNLRILSECRPPEAEPEAEPEPETVMEKLTAKLSSMWDNETTRVFIKASGAFAGVALVTWATIHRDHIMTRDALSQANQRIS